MDDGQVSDATTTDRMPPWYVAVVAVILLVILGILVVILLRDDGGNDVEATGSTTTAVGSAPIVDPTTQTTTASTASTVTTASTTTATSASTATSATSTTTSTSTSATTSTSASTSSSTSTIDQEQYRSAVWPWFSSTVRYDDPVEAARAFAEDFVGFDDPLVGPFLQGDSRSGEVEISSSAAGPTSVVFVRMLGPDNTWWVLGAATEHIVIDEPDALDEIVNPVRVAGQALAFEGTVDVELRADGSSDPLVDSFVTGGGTELGPFEASFDYTDPEVDGGALVLTTESAEDGRIQSVAVVRVQFARS